ncbi:MAG TPA: YggT family protein [Patescibacteria group bacterium]|nr:YggT family protein [Patescibacteria group bacterium]
MHDLLMPIFVVLDWAIGFYKFIVIASAVASWLVAFNVINTRNQAVYTIVDTLYRLTEPVLRRIRHYLPSTGGLDLSPIVLLIVLWLIQMYLPIIVHAIP